MPRSTSATWRSQYNLRLPRDEGFETLAGFVSRNCSAFPSPATSFLYQQRRFTVLEMEGRRVGAVKVDLVPAVSPRRLKRKVRGMIRYFFTRLSYMLPVVWLVVSVVFLLIHLVPGDPIQAMLGEGAAGAESRPRATPTASIFLCPPSTSTTGRAFSMAISAARCV